MSEMIRRHILALLQKERTGRPAAVLAEELGIGPEHRSVFRRSLDELSAEGRVILGPRDHVSLPALSGELTGRFRAHGRGFGFVRIEQADGPEEVYVPAKATGRAMHGDRVVVRLDPRSGRPTGRIVKILERAHESVVGVLRRRQDRWWVDPDGPEALPSIEVEDIGATTARPGDKVSIRIHHYPTADRPARGRIQSVLGRSGRYAAEIAAVIRRHRLAEVFPDRALVEAAQAKARFDPDALNGRVDLSDTLVLTIDPPDAQDHDDAVSLERLDDGHWQLGVHIADVSHFVPAGSALDEAARRRGNSVYLPGQTLPMLPEILSNDICSLRPGQRRYAKSVLMRFTPDGRLHDSRLVRSVVRSQARLSYEQVDRILRGEPLNQTRAVIGLLRDLESLAEILRERRRRAGLLSLDLPEMQVRLDAQGRAREVRPRRRGAACDLIETFMVQANEVVARWLDQRCLPLMRRIHPAPTRAALRRLSQTLGHLGLRLNRQPRRRDLQALLEQAAGSRQEPAVALLLLRSLSPAAYSPAVVGHYALACSTYCHFTSPIRRYADLLVHRVLEEALKGRLDRARTVAGFEELARLGVHLTQTEQTADEAEQEVKTILILGTLQERLGLECETVVSGISRFGVQVLLPDFGVEGRIRLESLGADQWRFDEHHRCLVGRHSRRMLRLGQCLRCRITAVHPPAQRLELEPAAAPVSPRPKRRSGGAAMRAPHRQRPRRRR